jgi:hypothetical protein
MNFIQRAKLNVVKRHWIQVGEERERERIINLLEEYGESYYISQETYDDVVAIIKGEK